MNVDEARDDADVTPALDSLDDTALRAIAYGRAATDRERMRARTASRILANRHASVVPGAHPARDAAGADDVAAGRGLPNNYSDVEDGPLRPSEGSDTGSSGRSPTSRPRSLRRGLLIGAIVGAFLAGGAIGIAAAEFGESLQPDSLAIFDRPATDVVTLSNRSNFTLGTGDARLLVERDGVLVYGVKTNAGFLGEGELGPQVCVVADTEDTAVQFIPFNCIPEQVFREHGMSGVLPAFEQSSLGFTPSVVRALAFQWGPRGGLQLDDISDDLLAAPSERYSEQDLLQGLDIPLVQVIRDQEPDPAIARELPGALFGPVDIGTVSAGAGVTARMWGSIFPDSDGSDGVAVCLSAEVEGNLVAHECASMAAFRTVGVDVSFDRADALVSVSVGPSGAVSAIIEE